MLQKKVWIIIGAEGLGLAAIKYLVSKEQIVMVLNNADSPCYPLLGIDSEYLFIIDTKKDDVTGLDKTLRDLTKAYGVIDYIINNDNYGIFNREEARDKDKLGQLISSDIARTTGLLDVLIPFLRKSPKGSLINIPPQLCLAMVSDVTVADNLATAMTKFLEELNTRLLALDCKLVFLQPGERLANVNF
jgi:short-subunit dehydrogenase involved in D-alanine esterification of teichoic acids